MPALFLPLAGRSSTPTPTSSEGVAFSVTATDWARGPWDPSTLHGGPVAALVGVAVERCGTLAPMQVTRATVELERPVPLGRLDVAAAVVRNGSRLQLVEVEVQAEGVIVSRARVLRQRLAEVSVPELAAPAPMPPPPSQTPDRPPPGRVAGVRAFHSDAVEHRFVQGAFEDLGPSTDWIRLLVDVVEGEVPSATQRALAAADFANGVSRVLEFDEHLFVNPELTVHLVRPPVGEWVCLRCRTDLSTVGAGLSSSWLFDEDGWLGASHQALYVEAR